MKRQIFGKTILKYFSSYSVELSMHQVLINKTLQGQGVNLLDEIINFCIRRILWTPPVSHNSVWRLCTGGKFAQPLASITRKK